MNLRIVNIKIGFRTAGAYGRFRSRKLPGPGTFGVLLTGHLDVARGYGVWWVIDW